MLYVLNQLVPRHPTLPVNFSPSATVTSKGLWSTGFRPNLSVVIRSMKLWVVHVSTKKVTFFSLSNQPDLSLPPTTQALEFSVIPPEF